MNGANQPISAFVAVGDSFTEGMNDLAADGSVLGWADRLAGTLAARDPGFRYANLAVRGKLLRQIVADQVPMAIEMLAGAPQQGLVSIAGGGNDLLRPSGDPDSLAEIFDAAVMRLSQAGLRVLVITGFDPLAFPLIALLRGKVATYNMHLRAIADAHGCDLLDLWGMRSLTLPAAWSTDRLHLNSDSHRRIAVRAAEVLGVAPVSERGSAVGPVPLVWTPPAVSGHRGRGAWLAARIEDYQWAAESFIPWIGRRLRGTSSGDGRSAKHPELAPVTRPAQDA
ncbi:MAG TPA: SGNH/GDSL hydrolase family protein [Trebonia sp.]|nr:SGNH/GDSL hydrolase family protein [Trebonia sp.]